VAPRLNWLNFRRIAQFQLLNGAGPRFNRCLIHFLPCFLSAQEPIVDAFNPGAAVIDANSPHHLAVRIDPAVAAQAWNPGVTPTTLDLPCAANFNTLSNADQGNWLDWWAGQVVTAAVETLGMVRDPNPAVANSFMAPASYERYARAVMDAAAPNPAIL
jgi:hypothetical protein